MKGWEVQWGVCLHGRLERTFLYHLLRLRADLATAVVIPTENEMSIFFFFFHLFSKGLLILQLIGTLGIFTAIFKTTYVFECGQFSMSTFRESLARGLLAGCCLLRVCPLLTGCS